MDWNRVEGNWKQAKGKVKEQWGKLTDDDLTFIDWQAGAIGRQDSGTLRHPEGRSAQADRRVGAASKLVSSTSPAPDRLRRNLFGGSGSPCGPSRGDPSFSFADQMHGDFALVWRASVLEQINPLPGSQGEPAGDDRNGELHAGQRRSDVGRHVVGAFVRMPISPHLLWRDAFKECLQIGADVRRGVLLNEQSGGGVPAEQRQEPGLHLWGRSQSTTCA